MEIVMSVNRSWIDDAYFNLYRPIHPGENSGGNVRGKCPNTYQAYSTAIVQFQVSLKFI